MLGQVSKYQNHIISFIILIIIGFFYNRYQEKIERENYQQNNKAIQDYLLRDPESLSINKRPILWIPITYDYNSRDWLSFGSRSSFDLNQPYLYLTVNSIITHCDKSFRICIVDDNAFDLLLPGWSIDMNRISKPITSYIRDLGLCKLLHKYGGMVVPPSFVCSKDLIGLYNNSVDGNKLFVCENIDRNSTATKYMYYPDMTIMGCLKENNTIKELIEYIEISISDDYTAETEFLGKFDGWCARGVSEHKINLIDPTLIGVKSENGSPILIDNLLANDYVDFSPNMYGIYIPASEILTRNNYKWFARLSETQVLESNTLIGKYILLSNMPDELNGSIEPFQNRNNWVKYYATPLLPNGVWGLKPNYLGNNMLSSKKQPVVGKLHY